MKISYNWLKQYTDFDLSPQELSEVLTTTGLEVERLEEFESVKGALEGVVVGEVLECERHPNADRLSLTKVNVGPGRIVPIVCGAPNVAQGQKVAVALTGTTLYSGDESFTIKKTKIRGEASEGMICASDELGIGDDHSGIMVLDEVAIPGQALSEIYPVVTDAVLEIGLTPNRIDGACHIGTARDIVAYLNMDEQKTKLIKPDLSEFKVDNTDMDIPVSVENEEACLRYSGICLNNVEVKESPDWLQIRLKAIGLNPINNIVDITNFVLHETGQPLHAFDADQIAGGKVIVKTLKSGSEFITLDEEKRKLTDQDLMICSETEGMCIAGVFGGAKSGVSDKTTKIFLESACFNPVWVRKTSKHHGLSTDSSFRFERGTDPNGTVDALKRAALLLKEVAGAEVASEIVDIYPEVIQPYPVSLSWKNLNRLIGIEIPKETVIQILELLDIEVVSKNQNGLELKVATYRVDVTRDVDVIEEILRIYGYNNVGISEHVNSTLSYAPDPDPELLENRIAEQLVAQGLLEIMANSLTKSSYYTDLPFDGKGEMVELVNPLSNDLKGMRRTLLYGGLESIKMNINYKRPNVKLFEYGNVYDLINPDKSYKTEGYHESRHLGIFISGTKTAENWKVKQEASNFYQLKGLVNTVLKRLGFRESAWKLDAASSTMFEEGLKIDMNGKTLVSFGKVHSKIRSYFEIEQDVYYADFNWDNILSTLSLKVKYSELSKYPEVRRDLALILDKAVLFEDLRQLAIQVEKKHLKSVNLFDVFESDKLGKGKKSYAISFILQDYSKTLNDKQIDKIMKNLVSAFKHKFDAELR